MKKIIILFFLIICNTSYSQNDYLLGESYYREGEYQKATQIFKKLYSKSPFNTSFLSRLISCYQETEKFTEVETLVKSKIKQNPNFGYLYVYLGYNYERQKQKELAQINYNLAIKNIGKKGVYGSVIGRIFKDYNLLDKAILTYKKTMKLNEKANYSFQIANIYGEKGDFKKMFESYIDLVDKNINYYNLMQRYTSKYITDDAENEANILFRKSLLRKSASNPKDIWNALLSWLFTQQKDYQKALIQEKALYQRKPEDLTSIYRLGKIAFKNKDYTAATSSFKFITQNSTLKEEKIDAHLYLLKIAIANKNQEVKQLFQTVFKEFGKNTITIKLQIEYADFLTFQQNKPEEAKQVLEKALTFSSSKFDKVRIKLKLGDVLVFTGKYNKALIYFSQIQTQLKGSELAQQARFKVAQTSYFKGDFTWAKAQLKVLKGSTTQLIANDAVDLYLKIVDNEPVDSIPSGLKEFANAELLSFQNKNEEALFIVKNMLNNNKEKPAKDLKAINITVNPGDVIYDDLLFLQAKLYIKLKKYTEAISSLEKIITIDNQGFLSDDVAYLIAETYYNQLNKPEKASEYYQKIIFDYSSSIYLVDARKKYRKIRGDSL